MKAEFTSTLALREVITSSIEAPSPSSSLYLSRSVHTRRDGLDEHLITGVHVIFKAGHANGLHDALHVSRDQKLDASNPDVAVKALRICCDTLEIDSELSLPESEVAIFARKITFLNRGQINTTPLSWALERAADFDPVKKKGGKNGAEGRHAGIFTLLVDSVDTPADENLTRFVGRGGAGQSAGHGKNGVKGKSLRSISASYRHAEHKPYPPFSVQQNTFTAKYSSPCVFASYKWHWVIVIESGNRGVNDWPTSGEDALAPGIPGSGGNGAGIRCNQNAILAMCDSSPGQAGKKAPDVTGGKAGTPTKSTHYTLTIRFDLANKKAGGDNTRNGAEHKTRDGASYPAKASANGSGTTTDPVIIKFSNSWVHPLQIESVLRFARDAFLAGARDELSELLKPYEAALALPMPEEPEAVTGWTGQQRTKWNAAQSEIAGIMHRLGTNLDYFGNRAGYMPLLSLQATMRLYDLDTKDAISTLLLATWVQDEANQAQSAVNAFGSAIDQTNKDTVSVAAKLVKAEQQMSTLDQELTSLLSRLDNMSVELGELRTRLYNQAAKEENKKALIKAGIKMAGAICQVIPVGQPVLGTIGSLANIVADIDDKGLPDTTTKVGDTITKSRTAANKAKAAKEKAQKAKKPNDKDDTAGAKSESSAWATAGDGLGPALSMAGQAIGALQVSEQDIEVELARLAAESSEWADLVEKIRTLNKDSARIFTELSAVLQAIGDGYARLASNADSVVTLQSERNQELGKLSAEANQVVTRMGQNARLSLQHTLYLLVKSYETTVFKPIAVDWSLDRVFDKITELLKPEQGFDAESIVNYAEVIAPLFDENKREIKTSLLEDFGFADMKEAPLEFGFTKEQTSEQLDSLTRGDKLNIDPLRFGLILPNRQRARLTGFENTRFRFSSDGPALPASGNAIISLCVGGNGTIRSGAHLYAVHSDAPRVWTWTYHFSSGAVEPSVPSLSSLDLLNSILESTDDAIRQKLASPPAWSDMTLSLDFSPPIAEEQRPKLESLLFTSTIESMSAAVSERVLDIRVESSDEQIGICPADLAKRGAGMGDSYRIYNNGVKVAIEAQQESDGRPFNRWEIINGSRPEIDGTHLKLALNANVLAFSRYQPDSVSGSSIHEYVISNDEEVLKKEITDRDQLSKILSAASKNTPLMIGKALPSKETTFCGRTIHSEADLDSPVIDVIEEGEEPSVLESSNGWTKVLHQGLIGHIADG